MPLIDPRDAGYGGKLEPDPPTSGDRFHTPHHGTATVVQLLSVHDAWHQPKSFLVRADDGSFWVLLACDPILDGISYSGRPVSPAPRAPAAPSRAERRRAGPSSG